MIIGVNVEGFGWCYVSVGCHFSYGMFVREKHFSFEAFHLNVTKKCNMRFPKHFQFKNYMRVTGFLEINNLLTSVRYTRS